MKNKVAIVNDKLKYKNFIGSIQFDTGDNIYFGEIRNIDNNLVMYEGNNIDELMIDFMIAVDDYLKTLDYLL